MSIKKNLFSMLNLKNKVHRDAFDLSHRNCFSAKVGELLPISVTECLPGDSFKVKTNSFTRSVPCQTAAFTRIYEYYDWFFVPFRLLQRSFNQDILLLNNENPVSASSTSQPVKSLQQAPYTTLNDITGYLNKLHADYPLFGDFNFDPSLQAAKLLSYLGYGDFITAFQDNKFQVNYNANTQVSLFPLAAYQKIYMDFYRYTQWEQNKPWCYNFDFLSSLNGSPNPSYIDVDKVSQSFYDNYFTLRYANYPKDIFHGLLPKSQYGDVASVNITAPTQTIFGTASSSRNSPRSLYAENGNTITPLVTGDQIESSSDVGITNSGQTKPISNRSLLIDVNNIQSSVTSSLNSFTAKFDVLRLRKAQALQRWSEITQSGSYDVTDQMRKHWNVDIPAALSDRCRMVGSQKGTILINEVVNTSLQNEDDIADIKGKGLGSSDGFFEFNTNEFGLLICIYHAVPDIDYNLNRQSFATQRVQYNSFPIPEFDQLGLESVYLGDLINTSVFQGSNPRQLFGYNPRYYQFKTALDVVNGVFTTTRLDWVPAFDYKQLQYFYNIDGKSFDISARFFKCDPRLLDNLFGVNVDSTVDTDTMYITADFDISVVRNLDRTGLPY